MDQDDQVIRWFRWFRWIRWSWWSGGPGGPGGSGCPKHTFRFVAPAKEIQEYLVSFTSHFHLYPHIKVVTHFVHGHINSLFQLNTRVESAVWEEEEGEWKVSREKGRMRRTERVIERGDVEDVSRW